MKEIFLLKNLLHKKNFYLKEKTNSGHSYLKYLKQIVEIKAFPQKIQIKYDSFSKVQVHILHL